MKLFSLKTGLMALTIGATALIYGCSKETATEEALATPNPLAFEQEFVVYDATGENSITINVSSDDASILDPYKDGSYELVINPDLVAETTTGGIEASLEEGEVNPFANPDSLPSLAPAVQIFVADVNFSENVEHYTLVTHITRGSEEETTDEIDKSLNFCWWYPKRDEDFEYWEIEGWGAISFTGTFNKSKNSCNNAEYYICDWNTVSPFAVQKLNHNGDSETTNARPGKSGITSLYRHKKNHVETNNFTW